MADDERDEDPSHNDSTAMIPNSTDSCGTNEAVDKRRWTDQIDCESRIKTEDCTADDCCWTLAYLGCQDLPVAIAPFWLQFDVCSTCIVLSPPVLVHVYSSRTTVVRWSNDSIGRAFTRQYTVLEQCLWIGGSVHYTHTVDT